MVASTVRPSLTPLSSGGGPENEEMVEFDSISAPQRPGYKPSEQGATTF